MAIKVCDKCKWRSAISGGIYKCPACGEKLPKAPPVGERKLARTKK